MRTSWHLRSLIKTGLFIHFPDENEAEMRPKKRSSSYGTGIQSLSKPAIIKSV